MSRDQARSRARGPVRSRTLNLKRLPIAERSAAQLAYPDVDGDRRPRTRGDCTPCLACQRYVEGADPAPWHGKLRCGHTVEEAPNHCRPCVRVGCRHNLYLDVLHNGNVQIHRPDLEPDEISESCSLDVADRGGATLDEVGACFNVTRERIRQLEGTALRHAKQREITHALMRGYRDGSFQQGMHWSELAGFEETRGRACAVGEIDQAEAEESAPLEEV